MQKRRKLENGIVTCIDCISRKIMDLSFEKDILKSTTPSKSTRNNIPFVGSGLIDLQINGINGIDFNTASLTAQDI